MFQYETPQHLMKLRALSHKVTWWLGTHCTKSVPFIFVLGYPKSGTTWVCQMAGDYLQLPFPRYSLLPVACPAVVHGHEVVTKKYPRGIYVMRDGRDALTSLYFHLARYLPEGNNPQLTRRQSKTFPCLVNRDNVADNITRFVESQMTIPHSCKVNWGTHVQSFFGSKHPNMVLLKYEDLRGDGEATFAQAMGYLIKSEPDMDKVHATFDKFSFAKQSGRKAGKEKRLSFLRKGQTGDWKNHFTKEAAEIFNQYCGDALIAAGYEKDKSWVDAFDGAPAPEEVVS